MPARVGSSGVEVPTHCLSSSELGMLLKSIQAFVTEFPKLEAGDVATKATRLINWKFAITRTISPAGPVILRWWNWCQQEAESVYRVFIKAPLAVRESLVPTSVMPEPWQQLEAWIRPRLLDSLPKDIQQWVQSRERQGVIDSSHVLLYYAMKSFAPGGAE